MSATPYERGRILGILVSDLRDAGDGSYDPRWDLADESKRCSRDEFQEFMRGLNEVMEERSNGRN